MDEHPRRNLEFEARNIFSAANHYLILLFGMSCLAASILLQIIFFIAGQFRIGIPVSDLLGIVLPVYLLTRRFPDGFARQLKLRLPEARMLLRVVLAGLVAVVVTDYIYIFSMHFIPAPESYTENLAALKPEGPGMFIITFLGICLIAPFAEELLFRGLVQQVFSFNMHPVSAFVLAGVLFGAAHWSAHLLVTVAVFGIFLGYIFHVTDNLIYPVIAHGIFNAVSFMELAFGSKEFLADPPFYTQHLWIFFASLIVLLLLLKNMKKGAEETRAPRIL